MHSGLVVAGGWCREPTRRWASYGAQSQDAVWPQSFFCLRPELGLVLCIRGMGGGAQQATFRGTLEAYLESALAQWSPAGTVEQSLEALRRLVQREFEGAAWRDCVGDPRLSVEERPHGPCAMVPESPTAQTSFVPNPNTPQSDAPAVAHAVDGLG